ncbi:HD domain-containing protein 2 [Platysternon megacephalum]|uniref:HD domain-containing protein 2 n=1 Tax=Platysternon megacephalum TaxID=55544 RepID=A0A4D9DVS1_9SAUR|nr:HD domain-containing protein 2 [Platysternon megacephalum]
MECSGMAQPWLRNRLHKAGLASRPLAAQGSRETLRVTKEGASCLPPAGRQPKEQPVPLLPGEGEISLMLCPSLPALPHPHRSAWAPQTHRHQPHTRPLPAGQGSLLPADAPCSEWPPGRWASAGEPHVLLTQPPGQALPCRPPHNLIQARWVFPPHSPPYLSASPSCTWAGLCPEGEAGRWSVSPGLGGGGYIAGCSVFTWETAAQNNPPCAGRVVPSGPALTSCSPPAGPGTQAHPSGDRGPWAPHRQSLPQRG